MENMVKLDKSGRFVLPKHLRDRMGTNTFLVDFEGTRNHERLVFKKVPSVDEMCGAFPEIDMDKHRKEHAKER
jgi:bifunctional DNA-binding transcriptional regulator/antitoxin component of YhaV-PrlF toxin-antitoxin module